MKKFVLMACFLAVCSVALAHTSVNWVTTTYLPKDIVGSVIHKGDGFHFCVCQIKGQTYTFQQGAVDVTKRLRKSSKVSVFKLTTSESLPVHGRELYFPFHSQPQKFLSGC